MGSTNRRRASSGVSFLILLSLWSASTSVAVSATSYTRGSGSVRSAELQNGRRPSLKYEEMLGRRETSTPSRQALQPQEIGTWQILQEAVSVDRQSEVKTAASTKGATAKTCSYTVSIKTSCSSPSVTRDAVSLAFGDAYKNEVYAARLDNPSSGTFARCSTDTFKISGPCGYATCYLYLRRIGRDGWTPESVKVTYSSYARDVSFYYGTPLPNGVWYGFNLCGNHLVDE